MSFPKLEIAPAPKRTPTTSRRRRTLRKTRTFHARLLGALTADSLSEFGTASDGSIRPVWFAFFCTVGAAKPFTANLRAGRPAKLDRGDRYQIPRSSSHRWTTHVVPGGVVTVAYLPELFHLQPAVPFTDDPRFIVAPERRWVERQAEALASEFGPDAPDAARAALFAGYLDRRTPLPLLRDLRFHLQLYRAALEEPWARRLSEDSPPEYVGFRRCGLEAPVVCAVDLATLSEFLTAQTAEFHRRHLRPARPLTPRELDRGLPTSPRQLGLDLGL